MMSLNLRRLFSFFKFYEPPMKFCHIKANCIALGGKKKKILVEAIKKPLFEKVYDGSSQRMLGRRRWGYCWFWLVTLSVGISDAFPRDRRCQVVSKQTSGRREDREGQARPGKGRASATIKPACVSFEQRSFNLLMV